MFPVRSNGMQRLIGLVPPHLSSRSDLRFEDLRNETERLLDVKVAEVNWFSAYRVHHRVAERFRTAVADEPFVLKDGKELSVTVSIGLAVAASADESQDSLLKRADDALYAAKNGGRNRTIAFTADSEVVPPKRDAAA